MPSPFKMPYGTLDAAIHKQAEKGFAQTVEINSCLYKIWLIFYTKF